jgi:hypothetical protein
MMLQAGPGYMGHLKVMLTLNRECLSRSVLIKSPELGLDVDSGGGIGKKAKTAAGRVKTPALPEKKK